MSFRIYFWMGKGRSSGSQSLKLKISFARSVTFSEMTYHLVGQLVTKKVSLIVISSMGSEKHLSNGLNGWFAVEMCSYVGLLVANFFMNIFLFGCLALFSTIK